MNGELGEGICIHNIISGFYLVVMGKGNFKGGGRVRYIWKRTSGFPVGELGMRG